MKKTGLVFGAVILLVAGYGLLVKKTIPQNIGENSLKAVEQNSYLEDKDDVLSLKNLEYKLTYTEYSFDDEFKNIRQKSFIKFKKSGTKDNIKIEFENDVQIGLLDSSKVSAYSKDGKYYEIVNDGEETEITEAIFRFNLLSILELYSPIDTSTGGVKYNSFFTTIDKFSQLFLNITGTVETPNEEFSITYNFINKEVKEIDYTEKTLDSDGYLVGTTHYEYDIN